MRLEDQRESLNVEDRRGQDYASAGISGRHIGIGSIVIALAASYFLGVSPSTVLSLLSGFGGGAQNVEVPAQAPPANDEMASFVSKILADTEDTWRDYFKQNGGTYAEPKLVLFTGETPTACGTGQTAMGPFYCPGDQKVYIDLAFYQELQNRFHAGGGIRGSLCHRA